ncbi:FliK family flagellar hook-length control protein, partial [Lactobacillus acidophilus]
ASFFATDIGKAFADDLQKYEAKDSYKAMTKQINDAQDAVANELKSSISKASMSTSLAGFDLGGIVSGITGTIWNVVSWLATNINP